MTKRLLFFGIVLFSLGSLQAGGPISGSGGGGGGAPSGVAGGDLGSTYPNPTVLSIANVTTGTLPVARGGTGITALGAGVATWWATPSSANLASTLTDETGTGAAVFATSPTLVTPALGTPTSVNLTNGTSLPESGVTSLVSDLALKAPLASPTFTGTVTIPNGSGLGTPTTLALTNATGLPISTGVSGLATGAATFLGTSTSANLASLLTDKTGSGSAVFATSPTLTTPTVATLNGLAGSDLLIQNVAQTQITTALVGKDANFLAGTAQAGSSVSGAAAGGNVLIQSGSAARLTSGNANGGDIVIKTGNGIGTGVGGQINFQTASSSRWKIDNTGNLIANNDSTYDFGASGANRVRDVYIARNEVITGLQATSAAAPTIASATTIAPTTQIVFVSGTVTVQTITPPAPISNGGGTITIIPTGIFATNTSGNIALASTSVVSKALIMTFDTTTSKWYPSY